jgi:hypothetical protein
MQRLMALIALLGAFVLAFPRLVGAQPFPLPQGPSGGSTTTYDARGQRWESFHTPTGSVTYAPNGERYETFESPAGVTTTYEPRGQKWETTPDPATAPRDHQR